MRIGHFYKSLGRPCDGAGIAALNLAKHQQLLGHEVFLYSWKPERYLHARDGFEIMDISEIFSLKGLRSKQAMVLRSSIKSLDVFHLHAGYYGLETLLVAQLASFMGIAYVYSPHGAFGFLNIKGEDLKKSVFRTILGLRFLNGAKWVHVFSPKDLSLLRRYGVKTRIKIFPNGITQRKHLSPDAPHWIDDLEHTGEGRITLGFLGRIDIMVKGLDLLLEGLGVAINNYGIRNLHLLIAGPDWYGSIPILKDIAVKLGVSKNIKFLGEIPKEQVPHFFRQIDCLVISSRFEGFPLVFAEACAFGCPVIVSKGSNVADLVRKYCVGLVADPFPKGFADAIKFGCEHPKLIAEMRENGKRLAQKLSWEAIAEQMCAAYQEAINER